jgi:hypothetical protein
MTSFCFSYGLRLHANYLTGFGPTSWLPAFARRIDIADFGRVEGFQRLRDPLLINRVLIHQQMDASQAPTLDGGQHLVLHGLLTSGRAASGF